MKRIVCIVLAACLALSGCGQQHESKTLYQDSVVTVTRLNSALCVEDNSTGQTFTVKTKRVKRDPNAVKTEKTLAQSDTVKIETVFDVVRIIEIEHDKSLCIKMR